MLTLTATLALWASPATAGTLDVCVGCTYETIADALAAAEGDDEIAVAAGTWEVGTTVSSLITIRGEGAGITILTIAADRASALQVTDGGDLTLQGLTLSGGGVGRGVLVTDSSLSMIDVTVQEGAGGSGAGVYLQEGSSGVFEGCTFSDNDAGSDRVGGHVVVLDSTLTVRYSHFDSGSASSGGAIWASDSTLDLRDSDFEDNAARPDSGSGYGGAVRADGGSLSISGGAFRRNVVVPSADGGGGGGGLSAISATVELVDVRFEQGEAPTGAGMHLSEAEANLVDVVAIEGVAIDADTGRGGGIAAFGGALLLDGGSFTDNQVDGGGFAAGGGVYANGATVTVQGARIEGNSIAGDGSVYGGGLYVNDGDLAMSGSSVSGNTAAGDTNGVLGGGIFARGDGAALTLSESTVANNQSEYGGGGLFLTDPSDGALASVSVDRLEISGNQAQLGAGLSLYTTTGVVLANSDLLSNTASDVGGGLYWRPGDEGAPAGSLALTDSRLRDNHGLNGGGLYALFGSELTLAGVDLVGNSAEDGGGAYIYGVEAVDVALSVFCGNSATVDDGGGASMAYTGDSEWSNVVLADNSAADNGGGLQVYEPEGALAVVNDSFLGNEATDNGGGLYVYGSSEVLVLNSLFAWTQGGDGFYSGEAVASGAITYNAWVDNSDADLGGALTTWGDGNIELDDPGLWDYSPGGDCDSYVFAHRGDSDLVDAGDPSIVEADGSASDIGAYGGAEAESGWLIDGDGDGFPGSDDCDDDDDAINPDATEIPYNGVDEDCDGEDLCDVDEDGADSELCGGDDCDDEDPDISPWADDLSENGVDENCDGVDGRGGGGTDGGGTDGGGTDGGGTDGGGTDGGGTDGGGTDGGGTDGGGTDGGTDGGTVIGDGGADGGDKDGGCGCASARGAGGSGLLFAPLGLLALGRRRR